MQDQDQVLLDKFTLKIKNQKMENEYQQLENKHQRKTLFPIIVLYQLGFLINYISKILNGINLLGLVIDGSTNLSLFILIICMKCKRFKKYSHISFYIMCVVMYVATVVNYIHFYTKQPDNENNKEDPAFDCFYLGATLFGIIIGPSLSYRMTLMLMFTSLYSLFIIYVSFNQRPLTIFIVLSHLTLYVYKIYFEEKQKRQYFISTKKVSFWESIIQNILLINLIVVKYDKESQRLMLENSNNTAKSNLKVKSDEDLQFFLEQTQIKIRGEKSVEDSYSTIFDQAAASASKLNKNYSDKRQKGLATSKSTISETLKRRNIRGNSNSSHITLKELVKEKLHQKQILSKNKGSAFGISDQNIQNLSGQYQNNKTGDVISFNLKIICFGMIEDYALICVEDETYKEKYSNQYLKNNLLLSILGDVMEFQKEEINSIHHQLDEGIHQLQSYYKNLQSIYYQKCNLQKGQYPKKLSEQNNLSLSKMETINSQFNLISKTQFSTQEVYDTIKSTPLSSPNIQGIKNIQNQNEPIVQFLKDQISYQKKKSQDYNQTLVFTGLDLNEDKQMYSKNDLISFTEQNQQKTILIKNDQINQTQFDLNQGLNNHIEYEKEKECQQRLSQIDLDKQKQAICLEFDHFDNKKQYSQNLLESPIKDISSSNLIIHTSEEYLKHQQKILKERINYTSKFRQSLLKLYSQVSKMQIKILNLENYLKGEKKISCAKNQISLDQMIFCILGHYRFDIETKKIKVTFKNQSNKNYIYQDSELLSNIFQNLIQNAIDYNIKMNGNIQIKVEDILIQNSKHDRGQIKVSIINTIDQFDNQSLDYQNTKFQGQQNSIYFGMERDSIQLSQIRYDRYLFGLRISQKNVRHIGPLNKIDIQFSQGCCTTSFIIYSDIEILNFK
ncbi:transmembrane protein, putative (macronuclear) [Tetrahymena thermophila SB210]|uniref:Transmembrane protein, putative n=1 Tax=Tetrahymena thermophila (strain SB210) TaxID=312017 RepID=I7MJM2_TETTS|nr:transmembrane protein, putative [Tetrahymena thermophila SB210]EAS06993.2 transmembrane protein, putative [Tetrahymena thermophila SB210]|eukprot:XP_001027235.2 transmembrane protein, putative [Tetrahymena thermophila SB210]